MEFMPFSFALVGRVSEKFLAQERRYNYTTPKTFLELIKLYKSLLAKKRETGACTRPLFGSTRAVSDAKHTLHTP